MDVDPEDAEQLAACAELATAIKSLLADVSQRGPVAVRERLSAALGRDVSDAQLDALVAGLSVDTVRGAVAAWLPGVNAGNDGLAWRSHNRREHADQSASCDDARRAAPLRSGWDPGRAMRRRFRFVIGRRRMRTRCWHRGWRCWRRRRSWSRGRWRWRCSRSCRSRRRRGCVHRAIVWSEAARGSWRSIGGRFDRKPRAAAGIHEVFAGPHLLLPQLADCTQCHAIDERPRRRHRMPVGIRTRLSASFGRCRSSSVRVPHGDGGGRCLPVVPQLSCGCCGDVAADEIEPIRSGSVRSVRFRPRFRAIARTSSGIRRGRR